MRKFSVSNAAMRDIRQISRHIRKTSPLAATKVRARIYAEIKSLAEFPGKGHVRDELMDETLRSWSVYSYLIIYRRDTIPTEILRIIHGSRDLPKAIENE